MTGKNLVDPELMSMLEMFPPLALSYEALPELRKLLADGFPTQSAYESSVELMRHRVPQASVPDGVEVIVYRSRAARGALPALLHLHGGGYIMGAPAMGHIRNCDFAVHAGCMIVSVDYRLAPENAFPSALEDAYAALKWMHANAKDLKIDPRRIGVIGESAGGGLAASLTQLARDRAEVAIAFQSLIYPMLDDRTVRNAEAGTTAGKYVWTAENNRFAWNALLGDHDPVQPPRYSVPARTQDVAGLPPAFIAVGALDLFVDENLQYANRLVRAGVATELHLYPGAVHGFDLMADAGVAQRFRSDHISAIQRALGVRDRAGEVV